jgi:hypothetical protein
MSRKDLQSYIDAWEKARCEWLETLTFSGVKNPEGLRRYAVMTAAGEALDKARVDIR